MGSFLSSLLGDRSDVVNLDSETFQNQIENEKDLVLIDVRTENEYMEVRIPNSVLIDIYQPCFTEEIDKLERTKSYYVYCRSGNRSHSAAKLMRKMGFEKVYNLAGGIIDWYGPTEKG